MPMSVVREPAVAGRFYPADPDELRAAIQRIPATRPRRPRHRPRELSRRMPGTSTRVRLPATAYAVAARTPRPNRPRACCSDRRILSGCAGWPLPSGGRVRDAAGPRADRHAKRSTGADACRRSSSTTRPTPASTASRCTSRFCRRCWATFKLVPFAVGEATADEVAEVMRIAVGRERRRCSSSART